MTACGRTSRRDPNRPALPNPAAGSHGRLPRTRSASENESTVCSRRTLTGIGTRLVPEDGSVSRGPRCRTRPLKSVLQDVPRQHRALDPDRVLDDPLERDEVTELLLVGFNLSGHHATELLGHPPRILHALADHSLRHHRGAGLTDRTASSLEGKVRNPAVL